MATAYQHGFKSLLTLYEKCRRLYVKKNKCHFEMTGLCVAGRCRSSLLKALLLIKRLVKA